MAEKNFFLGEKCFALALLVEMDKGCPSGGVSLCRFCRGGDENHPRSFRSVVHSENRVSLGEDQVYSQSRRELRQGRDKGFLAEGIFLCKG